MNVNSDPIGSFLKLESQLKKYVKSAFGTNSGSFEAERSMLLDTPGVFFQEPYLEILPEYKTCKQISALETEDLPGLSSEALTAFTQIAGSGLMPKDADLFIHQQSMDGVID